MKKNLRTIIYLMIVIVIAGGIYLYSRGSSEGILDGLDPASFDAEATCTGIENHTLVCNAENDAYLYLDDVEVFLQKADTQIEENGDEKTSVSYEKSSIEELSEKLKEKNEISIAMWLTGAGKVKTVIILEQSFENNSASLASLEGLDPDSYTAAGTALRLDQNSIRLAPVSYTTEDRAKFAEYVKDYALSRDVRFYLETVRIKEQDGEVTGRNLQYAKITFRQAKERISEEGTSVYVWFNQYGNIANVMICIEEAADA